MIDLDKLRKSKGHVLAIVDTKTGEYEPLKLDIINSEAIWVKTGQSFVYPEKFRNYSCSLCGFDVEKTKYRYCPNCGARMDIDEQRKGE